MLAMLRRNEEPDRLKQHCITQLNPFLEHGAPFDAFGRGLSGSDAEEFVGGLFGTLQSNAYLHIKADADDSDSDSRHSAHRRRYDHATVGVTAPSCAGRARARRCATVATQTTRLTTRTETTGAAAARVLRCDAARTVAMPNTVQSPKRRADEHNIHSGAAPGAVHRSRPRCGDYFGAEC